MSNMFSEINLLQKGLDASWLRNEVINNNIANEDTPNFKRSAVDFEEFYKAALENKGDFRIKRTREKHLSFGESSELSANVVQDNSTTMRMDGNNVDIDKEMVDLAKNTIFYQSLTVKLNSEIAQLKAAIKG